MMSCKKNILSVWIPLLVMFCMFMSSALIAQSADNEVKAAIDKLEKGQRDEVKLDLPRLAAKYQNNPGVIYLQGRLASDGIEAVKSYQSLLDNFPNSEWADDALYRIYQYYYALGLYKTAEIKMQELKKEYPHSVYVTGKPAAKLPSTDEIAVKLPTKETDTVAVSTTTAEPPLDHMNTPVVTAGTQEPYTLQVGAFSTVANAEKQKNYFEDLGYDVEVTNKVRGGRSLYLVWAGNYKSADEARKAAKDIKAKHKIDSIVVERY